MTVPGEMAVLPALSARRGGPLRVGVARMDGLGDWLMTVPLLQALRESSHVNSVTAICPDPFVEMLGALPQVDAVGLSDSNGHRFAGRIGRRTIGPTVWRAGARASGSRFRGRFDVVVLPRWGPDSGREMRAWARAAGAFVVGHDPAAVPGIASAEARQASILDRVVHDPRADVHELDHLRRMATSLGLELGDLTRCGREFLGRMPEAGGLSEPAVVAHVGTGAPHRTWPEAKWVELIQSLSTRIGMRTVLLAAPAEAATAARILAAAGSGAATYPGPLSLLSAARTVADAAVFVGGDSGPMHLACAMDTPVIVISPHPANGDPAHSNSPSRFGPWATRHAVLRPRRATPPCSAYCAAQSAHCISQVDIAAVAEQVERLVTR